MAKTAWIIQARKRAIGEKTRRPPGGAKGKKDYAALAQLPRDASPTRVSTVAKSPAAVAPLFAGSECRVSLFVNWLRKDSSWP